MKMTKEHLEAVQKGRIALVVELNTVDSIGVVIPTDNEQDLHSQIKFICEEYYGEEIDEVVNVDYDTYEVRNENWSEQVYVSIIKNPFFSW